MFKGGAILLSLLMVSACAIGPDYARPNIKIPADFKEALRQGMEKQRAETQAVSQPDAVKQLEKAKPQDEEERGQWWRVFNDPVLDELEEQVAAHNQSVKSAEASFRQARAVVREARGSFFPTVTADASMSRSKAGQGSTGSLISHGVRDSYSASADAGWSPDFWGKVRREVESNEAGAQANAADLASALLSAQGELVADYLSLRIADEQDRLLGRSIDAYQKSLTITQNQYNAGIAASSDVLQAKVQLQNTQAQQVDVGVARAQYEHAIAVLTGKAPTDFSLATVDAVPELPQVPVGVPSQLLQRRPDIASAERSVAAANAQIGVAEAAYFPDITLSASGGYESSRLARWFTLPSHFWSIGPSLVEGLFDAGLRSAQTEAAIAVYDKAAADYRQTVLSAFQEVEDRLAALRIYAQEAEILQGAVKDADQSAQVSLNQYKSGTVSYLNVVTAQTAALNAKLSALNVRKQRLVASAGLIQALGGGWDAAALDKPSVTQGETHPWNILPPGIHENNQ